MPWWERRMWLECLEEEFSSRAEGAHSDGEEGQPREVVTDDLSALGIVAHRI